MYAIRSYYADGQGSLLTTSNCLIAHNRNPGYDKADFERLFTVEMGIERTLWLDHGKRNNFV